MQYCSITIEKITKVERNYKFVLNTRILLVILMLLYVRVSNVYWRNTL